MVLSDDFIKPLEIKQNFKGFLKSGKQTIGLKKMRLNKALELYSGNCKRSQAPGWPPERRLRQSARMRAAKIWRKSSGPKTRAGKDKSRMNATKTGRFNAGWQALRRAFSRYRRFLKWANAVLEIAQRNPCLSPLEKAAVFGGPALDLEDIDIDKILRTPPGHRRTPRIRRFI